MSDKLSKTCDLKIVAYGHLYLNPLKLVLCDQHHRDICVNTHRRWVSRLSRALKERGIPVYEHIN